MTAPTNRRGRWRTVAAILLIALVALSWTAVAAAGLFLELTTRQWVLAVAAAAVATEVALYIGAVLLGITLLQRIRARLRLRRHR